MKRAVYGLLLVFLFISILNLGFNIHPTKAEPATITVPDDYSTIQEGQQVFGITNNEVESPMHPTNDETLINPITGQYSNYIAEYYENEELSWSGWFNVSYNEYVSPNIINTTQLLEIPSRQVHQAIIDGTYVPD